MSHVFPFVPADRIARRTGRASPIEPIAHRRSVARSYASLNESQRDEALKIVQILPRLIHQLAREGALAAPAHPEPLQQKR